MSDHNIDSILQEDRLFNPPAAFVKKARINSKTQLQALWDQAESDYEGF